MGRTAAPWLPALGQRLRALREAQGLTQEQLGERAGFSGKYISEVERGLRDLPLSSLRAIAHQALGASFEQVFRGLESQPLLAREPTVEELRLPNNVTRLAQALGRLPPARRRKLVAAMRAIVSLTER